MRKKSGILLNPPSAVKEEVNLYKFGKMRVQDKSVIVNCKIMCDNEGLSHHKMNARLGFYEHAIKE